MATAATITPGGFVWLASYPKSGNTWLRLALESLSGGGQAVDFTGTVARRFSPLAGGLSEMTMELDVEVSELPSALQDELLPDSLRLVAARPGRPDLLFRKVHDCWGRTPSGRLRLPPEITHAAIHIVRDPRDIAPSWAHHANLSIDAAIDFMAKPDATMGRSARGPNLAVPQPLTSWSAHTQSWLEATPTPLLIRYEDMVANPAQALENIARHCGQQVEAAMIAGAVAATRFDLLRAREAETGFRGGQTEGRRFFRRGMVGGWRDSLTPTQVARIVATHGDMMRRLGYDP
jgi:aryl sulfotransferase